MGEIRNLDFWGKVFFSPAIPPSFHNIPLPGIYQLWISPISGENPNKFLINLINLIDLIALTKFHAQNLKTNSDCMIVILFEI
ncbi:hypothetical protein COT78_03900 [Candidatus Berkelbacteria bacterium CG10_big_fil_rev_8_21_14_0_10_43_13]|uniref:Uncharacterized protein n=1 Tax=Candidatus Berkelbacteria bacterium CG10_big_fil_rev_8_21_14_0_10_43_13 TaxID=1974514 RepID=A0A2H0W5J9_9BACT|nr:MAG: hypothetical protein COT78_03900 [Candidatus Berkelbacteria bacterium CG10_big_fil_rev_8_21_14_0_10_43_13]